jgi:nickel/cobalt transporter (NicO) family protein
MRAAKLIRWLAAALSLLFLIATAPLPAAAQNPFGPKGPTQTVPAAPAVPQEEPSLYNKFLAQTAAFQREMVRDIGRYMAAIRDGTGSAPLLVGIGFAFLYGVVHTLGPGHGKMVVASYFVGRDARVWRGIGMGAQIALTHVISAVLIVWLVDITVRQMLGGEPAESRWIRLVSFGLIALIGAIMLVRALRNTFSAADDHEHHDHGHGHDHGHDHHGHSHSLDWRQEGLLAVLAGVVPCTGAILIMLFALANGIVLAGIAMVFSISVGMAITMAAIGIGAIYFRRVLLLVTGEGSRKAEIVRSVLEYAAALLILAIGLSFLAGTLAERMI